MSWAESLDRVLTLRKIARLEAEKAELIAIIQEIEKRFAVVVNRRAHESLKDVPSWKDPDVKAASEEPRRMKRLGGMTTWRERQRVLEKRLSVKTEKFKKRVEEIREALGQKLGPTVSEGTQPRAAVPHELEGEGNVGA